MNDGITLVTAFFDCNRGESSYQARTNEKYLDYFRFWARLKNKLIIYTTSEFKEKVLSIRQAFNLESRTVVITVDDVWEIEHDIYALMKDVEKKSSFIDWRYRNKDISNNADYNYIMLMKYWCMQDAVRRKLTAEMVCWFDFGWNHGGEVFSCPEEFDFEWKYGFTSKIHLFSLSDPSNDTGIIRLQSMTDSIMGSPVICAIEQCSKLYEYCKQSMYSLLSLDCYDDDQMLLRMAYKLHNEDFEIHLSNWFLPLKEFGGGHLTVAKEQMRSRHFNVNFANIYYKIFRGMSKEEFGFMGRLLKIMKEEI